MCADSNTVSSGVEGQILIKGREMKNTMHMTARVLLFGIAVAIGVSTATCQAQGQERKAVNLAPARGLPFNDAIIAGDTLYIAGQEGTDEAGKLASGGIGPETTAALDNIQKIVKAAGFEMKDIVNVTVYLADIHEFPDMNKVYKGVMPDPKPARATIQAAALVNNARIEISAIAVKQK
jgi:2-iminobutanoate/2-iminopropanoate deaminase